MSNESAPPDRHLHSVPAGSEFAEANLMTPEMVAQREEMQAYHEVKQNSTFNAAVEQQGRALVPDQKFGNPYLVPTIEQYDDLSKLDQKITHNDDGTFTGPDGVKLNPIFSKRIHNYVHHEWILSAHEEQTIMDTLEVIGNTDGKYDAIDKLYSIEDAYDVDLNTKPDNVSEHPDVATESEVINYWKTMLVNRLKLSKELSARELKADAGEEALSPKEKKDRKNSPKSKEEYLYEEPEIEPLLAKEAKTALKQYIKKFGPNKYGVPTPAELTDMQRLADQIVANVDPTTHEYIYTVGDVVLKPNKVHLLFMIAESSYWSLGSSERKSLMHVTRVESSTKLTAAEFEAFSEGYYDAKAKRGDDFEEVFHDYQHYAQDRLALSKAIQSRRASRVLLFDMLAQQKSPSLGRQMTNRHPKISSDQIGEIVDALGTNDDQHDEYELPTINGIPTLLKEQMEAAGESVDTNPVAKKDLNSLSAQRGKQLGLYTPSKMKNGKRRTVLDSMRNRTGGKKSKPTESNKRPSRVAQLRNRFARSTKTAA